MWPFNFFEFAMKSTELVNKASQIMYMKVETTRCLALNVSSSQLGGQVVQIGSCIIMCCSSGVLAAADLKFNVLALANVSVAILRGM